MSSILIGSTNTANRSERRPRGRRFSLSLGRVSQNSYAALIVKQNGTRLPGRENLALGVASRPLFGPAEDIGWYRVDRDCGLLTAYRSGDGRTGRRSCRSISAVHSTVYRSAS